MNGGMVATLAILAAAGLVPAAAVLALAPLLARRRLQRRVRAVAALAGATLPAGDGETRAPLRRAGSRPADRGSARRLAALVPRLSQLETRLRQAGLEIPPQRALGWALGLGGGGALVALLLSGEPLLAALAFPLTGVLVPAAVLARLRARRERAFLSRFPDAIDLVVRAVKSGMPPTEAVTLIAEECEEPVAGVFREVASAVRIGTPFEEALWNAARLIALPEFRFFVIALSIQRETGGNLAEILSNLSTMIRRREQMKMKIRAMSSEARASALIIGSLPFIMAFIIYLINPEYMSKLFTDPRGWNLLLYGLCSMGLGTLVIARMVRFEI